MAKREISNGGYEMEDYMENMACGRPDKCDHEKRCNECKSDGIQFDASVTADYEIIDIFWWKKVWCSNCNEMKYYHCVQ